MGQINIRETGETYLTLQKIASLREMNVSELIREAIRSSLPAWLAEIREEQRKKLPYQTNPAQVELETDKLAHELREHNAVTLKAKDLFTARSLAIFRFLETVWAEEVGEITESQREKWVRQLGVKVNLKKSAEVPITEEEVKASSETDLKGRARRKVK